MPATQNGFPSIKFGRLLVCNDGGTWGDDPDEETEATLVLRSTDQTESGQWSLKEPALRRLAPSERHRAQLLAGDLVMTKSSGSAKHIGKTTIVSPEIADTGAAFSNFMQRFRLRSSNAPQYYWYVTQSRVFRNQILLASTTTTGLSNLTGRVVATFSVPQPSLKKQQQIADYLDHETAEIDAFIMDLDSFISLLHESLGAIRSELFGQPTTHEAISLKRLARQVSGSGFPHDYQGDPAQEIPFFKVGSLKDSVDGKLSDSPNTVSTSTAKALGAMIFPKNTVVLAKIGAALFLNRTARLGKPSCIDNNMLGLIPHPGVNPEFLQGIISNMDLVPLGNPGAVPSLNMAWYREQPAWLPSYTNQQEIVETYRGKKDDISSLITGANRAIDLARERRAALITAAVTGQIDVTARNKPAAEQLEDDIAQGLHREYA